MPWLVVLASFHGVKTPTMAYFYLSACYPCRRSLEEMHRINSHDQHMVIVASWEGVIRGSAISTQCLILENCQLCDLGQVALPLWAFVSSSSKDAMEDPFHL